MPSAYCSLSSVNNEHCHNLIRVGGCPGISKGECVNDIALKRLENLSYQTGFYCDMRERFGTYSTRRETSIHIIQFMKRTKKRNKK